MPLHPGSDCQFCKPLPCECSPKVKQMIVDHELALKLLNEKIAENQRYVTVLLNVAQMPKGDVIDSADYVQQMCWDAVHPPKQDEDPDGSDTKA